MTPDAIRIATDILRELGLEDVARWVEHPDAVRELLRHDPASTEGYSEAHCPACDMAEGYAHARWMKDRRHYCPVAAAWRALGDPRGAADIERAHEEALEWDSRRPSAEFPRGIGAQTLRGRLSQVERLMQDGLISREQSRRVLEGIYAPVPNLPGLIGRK
jgi:hypothetical protein